MSAGRVVMHPGLLFVSFLFPGVTQAGNKAPTKTVLLKIAVDIKDATLEFFLDDREISAKVLRAPMKVPHGAHELVVLRNSELQAIYQFEVGPKTGAEIVL